TDRRARIARGGALLDGDCRRESLDRVDVRLLHLLEELPRVRRQRLDVPPLPLGKDGVEGQRRLARPGHAGDDHELVAGDDDVDVLEVVLARAANDDGFHVIRLGCQDVGMLERERNIPEFYNPPACPRCFSISSWSPRSSGPGIAGCSRLPSAPRWCCCSCRSASWDARC